MIVDGNWGADVRGLQRWNDVNAAPTREARMRLARYARYGDPLVIPGTNVGVNVPGLTTPVAPAPAEPLFQPLNLILAVAGVALIWKGAKAIGQAALGAAALDMVARQVSPQYASWRAGVIQQLPQAVAAGGGLQVNIPGLSTNPPGVTFVPAPTQAVNGWRR